MKARLLRDVTTGECFWLSKDFKEGDEIYLYNGPTYGCISRGNEAFTEEEDKTPFFELPSDAVEIIS